MKTYTTYIVAILISGFGLITVDGQNPQKNYELSTLESGATKKYVARDYVSFKPGFSYVATPSTTFNAKIDAGLLFPPTANSYMAFDGTMTTDSTVGASIGNLHGSAGVSGIGTSTYEYPILCPPGINGLSPQVSIVYNSALTEGLLGRGFDIANSSKIVRVAHDRYLDNSTHSVSFDGNDRFMLDGMRLICDDNANYGKDQTVYHTENNFSSRIKSLGEQGDGPLYFTIETADGKLLEYGSTADSRFIPELENGIFIWYLNKITDVNGNTIEYIYNKQDNKSELYLSQIKYAGTTIDFIYTTYSRKKQYFVNGNEVNNNYLLTRIGIRGENAYLKNYIFSWYRPTGQYLLASIKEFYNEECNDEYEYDSGEENYLYKKPVLFSWTNQFDSQLNNELTFAENTLYIDIDGDGYDDKFLIEKVGPDENGYYTYKQKILLNKGTKEEETFYQEFKDEYKLNNPFVIQNSSVNSFCDIDGDGISEIVYKGKSVPNSLTYRYNLIFKSLNKNNIIKTVYQKSYLSPLYLKQDMYSVNSFQYKEFKVIYGDFDKDRKTEVLLVKDDNECFLLKYVDGVLVENSINLNGLDLFSYADKVLLGDYDGDGSVDLGINSNGVFTTYRVVDNLVAAIYSFPTTVKYVADVNQDGITDLVNVGVGAAEYDSYLQSNISTLTYSIHFRQKNNQFKKVEGTLLRADLFSQFVRENFPSFSASLNQLTTTETLSIKDVRFDDTDGDGLLNLIILYDRKFDFEKYYYYGYRSEYMTAESKEIISKFMGFEDDLFALNSDDTFVYPNRNLTHFSYWINTSGNIAIGGFVNNEVMMHNQDYYSRINFGDTGSRYDYNKLILGDLNGNGLKKIGMVGKWESYLGTKVSVNSRCILPNDEFNKRFLLSEVTDSYGNKTSVEYAVNKKNFESETSLEYPYFRYKTGMATVKSISNTNRLLNYKSTSYYSFSDEVFHRERGFMGYRTSTITNPDGVLVTNTASLNTDFACLIPYQSVSSVTKSISDISLIDKGNKRYIARVDKSTEEDCLQSTKIIKTYSSYDANENPTEIKTEYGENSGISSVETLSYIQKGAWYPNKILTQRITQTSPNVSNNVRTKEYTYYDNGNVESIIIDKGDVNELTTFYIYDQFGNLSQTSVKSKDRITNQEVTRTTNYAYTPSGRFISSKVTPQGQITSYRWDETNGLLQSEEMQLSLNGLKYTTSYKYDIWGNLVETVHPDGKRTAQVFQWADATNGVNATYYLYSQTSGAAPVFTWYDALGREVLTETFGFDKKKVSVFKEYYSDGRLKRVSAPTFNQNAELWDDTFGYDTYGRLVTVAKSSGIITTTNYAQKTITTTTDYGDKSIPNTTQSVSINDAGQKVLASTNGKSVSYTYHASGLQKSITPTGGQSIDIDYDLQGNRKSLIDPDAGCVEFLYNGFGELVSERQKVHVSDDYVTTTNTYKANGLLDNQVCGQLTTRYSYDNDNRLTCIENSNGQKTEYAYDYLNRVNKTKQTVGARVFERKMEYDVYGRLRKNVYPTGYYTLNNYDEYGNLLEVNDIGGRSLWKGIDENARGQLLNSVKGSKIITQTYDDNGLPSSLFSNNVIYYTYSFNNKGNLIERKDNQTTQIEKFAYDMQDRLTDWSIYHNITSLVKTNTITYDGTTGNIEKKTDLGELIFRYGEQSATASGTPLKNSNPGYHAVTSISGVPESFSLADLTVNYTDFKKIASLNENGADYEVEYGVDNQRCLSKYYAGGKSDNTTIPTLSRYYLGDYEEEITSDGSVRKIHYLSGAILIQETGKTDKFYYTYTDYQGTLLAITDEAGNLVERYAFDPWGQRRNPDDWTQKDNRLTRIVNRGYTGHEHIDEFGVVNMNGRVYDPLTAMFLSPDPFIQAPDNWVNYNRYGYCYGNPFKYTDPDGDNPLIIAAIVIGAYLGGSSVNGTFNPVKWDYSNWQTYAGIAVGGVAGWLGSAAGVGIAASAVAGGSGSVGTGIAGGMIGGMVSGGINGVGITAIMGGSFNNIMVNMTKGVVVGGFAGAMSGGVGTAIGDFSGVSGSAFKNGVYELGHSALKGAATGLAGGAMMATMEQDASYLWKGAALGTALSLGMAGVRITTLGAAFIPDSKYGMLEDYGQVYRRGSIFMPRGSGVTLGRNVAVRLTGNLDYDRYLMQHETGHLSQINNMGMAKFYGRTVKEYLQYGLRNVYCISGTLEYGAESYAFQRLGYYYGCYGRSIVFP